MTAPPALTLVVADGNAPWVRSLFLAMPAGVRVRWVRPEGPVAAARNVRSWPARRGWRPVAPGVDERWVVYPGWTRAPGWSARVIGGHVRRAARAAPGPVAVVYTLPFYGAVAARLPDVPAVYFAFDPYEFYDGWDPAAVRRGEDLLFRHCRAAFAISDPLAADFRGRTDKPVFVQPNGLPADRLAPAPAGPRPADLPAGRPVVGCVGQIGEAYDWDLLDRVTAACPELDFVFVGPVFPMPAAVKARMDAVWARPNVRWLGWRDPAALPGYLAGFDVCLSPLAVTPANDRRSLLRLYDYLATDKPVVATPIWSAACHGRQVAVAAGAGEMAGLLRAAVAPGRPAVDAAARRAYLTHHTWDRRAAGFLAGLRSVVPEAGPGDGDGGAP